MAGKGVGCDVVVRGVPDGQAASEYDDLGRLVFDTGSRGDLARKGALRANVHQEGGQIGILSEKGLDLVQGRLAGGSSRAVFIKEGELGRKKNLHILLTQDPLHQSSRCDPSAASLSCVKFSGLAQ